MSGLRVVVKIAFLSSVGLRVKTLLGHSMFLHNKQVKPCVFGSGLVQRVLSWWNKERSPPNVSYHVV